MSSQLPTKPETRGRIAEGFVTPKEDGNPQKMSVPPRRVIPIVFLPGIMGSNLRTSAARQKLLQKSNNIAWRPDRAGDALALVNADPAARQLQLDPDATEVDIYEHGGPTGSTETAEERHATGRVRRAMSVELETPLLMDDAVISGKVGKTKEQKALERGWGEVYFSSYRRILKICEQMLNEAVLNGKLTVLAHSLVGVAPAKWRACPQLALQPLTENDVKNALARCWFPVHAMGYNWLESNERSGIKTARRIGALIDKYRAAGYRCEKVILVTHSMGGLVARAAIHPSMGNISEKVLGIVHGVMPAIGAAAAYKRMRCGFEEGLLRADPAPKVLGLRRRSDGCPGEFGWRLAAIAE